MSSAVQELLERAVKLTVEERRELIEALARTDEEARRQHVSRLHGKYADVLTPTDEFMLRKREEVALEDRCSDRTE